ncbi:hypothetical protein PMIN01_06561 [Paraphaeosphaeria minitans]|uniref:Uncharacterized protein n=1 Tax=Paraphaeosphaeria minitans TaxID=565426 RepID=A0A9P6GGB9_9PLEO|nr:hypothetical protein PMIN01_06561 [Paraphaeosphaeria minitans]
MAPRKQSSQSNAAVASYFLARTGRRPMCTALPASLPATRLQLSSSRLASPHPVSPRLASSRLVPPDLTLCHSRERERVFVLLLPSKHTRQRRDKTTVHGPGETHVSCADCTVQCSGPNAPRPQCLGDDPSTLLASLLSSVPKFSTSCGSSTTSVNRLPEQREAFQLPLSGRELSEKRAA